jgi:hypothetical protein
MAGHLITVGTGATITASQMVLGTSEFFSVLIPSTNTSALIVSGGVSVGRLWVNGTTLTGG